MTGKTIGHVTVIRRGDKDRPRTGGCIPPLPAPTPDQLVADVCAGHMTGATLDRLARAPGPDGDAARTAREMLREVDTAEVRRVDEGDVA